MFDEILRKSDLGFWGRGKHQITAAEFFELWQRDEAVLLDVRSPEEVQFLALPFALHIPITELPDRLNEVPQDKLVATLCPGGTRAAISYAYLRSRGFENVRVLKGGLAGLLEELTPGKIRVYSVRRKRGS